ncbi:MAG: murein L,D-transpeptidase [Holophagales bacterium]|nr:murein L,D-transpeptidase [Holophagales bacterium]
MVRGRRWHRCCARRGVRNDPRLLQTCALALLCVFPLQSAAATTARKAARSPRSGLSSSGANDASRTPRLGPGSTSTSSILRAQVLLDRAHFSPGEIDGHYGGNTRRAVAAFNESRRLKGGEKVDAKTWAALNRDTAPVVVPYVLTPGDVGGPFEKLPTETPDRAKLSALGFESVVESLGERFHASPGLLRALNPGAAFDAGASIQVPNVERVPLEKAKGITVRVSESDHSAVAVGPDGAVLARYPATVGSEHDPLPLGEWKINGVATDPSFNYNPELFWDSEPGDEKAKLPPGPNNPVGVVWIDLSKPHYGIHGTPEPSTIGGKTSHGCIRLTNWDARELGDLVSPGAPAHLVK